MTGFDKLGIRAPILSALKSCGYQEPTVIQKKAIPFGLQGRDVLGCAQTGTGKTCAFGVPILQILSKKKSEGQIRALILTPTRELAIQIDENLKEYGRYLPLKELVIFGGVGQAPQVEKLSEGVDILTATPGRLLDLHSQGLLDLSTIEILVLDEADRMLDMGFIHDVRRVLKLLPKKKQTMFFTATLPEEIMKLVDELLIDPARVEAAPVSSPVEIIRQEVCLVDRSNKTKLLLHLLNEEHISNVLVFTRTKHGADKVVRELKRYGVSAAAIHGNKSQTARQESLRQFKDGMLTVLAATDIAARGLDIENLAFVVNYNLPEVPETYIHRIGRTGRAGKGGTAISFCDFGELPMLKAIEKLLKNDVSRREHPYPMEVFEAGKRDSRGRLVNPEDEEARQAAREQSEKRRKAAAEKKEKQRAALAKQELEQEDLPTEIQKSSKKIVQKKTEKEAIVQKAAEKKPKKKTAEQKTAEKKAQKKTAEQKAAEKKPKKKVVEQKAAEKKPEKKVVEQKAAEKKSEKKARQKISEKTDSAQEIRTYSSGKAVSYSKPKRGNLQDLLDSLPSADEPVEFFHRNPLEGERIMDATARLLAPSTTFRYRKEKNSKSEASLHDSVNKQGTLQKNRRDKRQKPEVLNRMHEEKTIQAKVRKNKKIKQSQETKKKADLKHPEKEKKSKFKQRAHQMEAPVNRQKDSTEQHSLMKPFYLNQDN